MGLTPFGFVHRNPGERLATFRARCMGPARGPGEKSGPQIGSQRRSAGEKALGGGLCPDKEAARRDRVPVDLQSPLVSASGICDGRLPQGATPR